MRRASFLGLILLSIALLAASTPSSLAAQAQTVQQQQLETYAKAYVAIGKLRDQFQAEFAEARNKKAEAVQQLHDRLRQEVASVLQAHGFSEPQYNHLTYVISTDAEVRKAFDKIMGIEPPPPPPAAASSMPGNPHIGHVMNSFNGTPNADGLLPTAMGEARVVAQHAGLAARNSGDLAAMKVHAAHVVHAIEAGDGTSGPGLGYGLMKAAAAVAAHIELAAKAADASQNVTTHAVHIATAARNTVQRAEEIVAIARQIEAAVSATEAADLVAKLNALAEQLTAGVDANGDGKVGWDHGEGGLQHVQQHLQLLVQAEGAK